MPLWKMPFTTKLLGSAVVVLPLLTLACGATPPRQLLIRAGRLIDGTGAAAQSNVVVSIEDGLIRSILPDKNEPAPAGVHVIDARTLTVMPGMVNAHAHLFSGGGCDPGIGTGPSQAFRNLHAALRGGVTSIADLGAPVEFVTALRRHVGTGRHRGPRVFVSGPVLTAKDGYPIDFMGREAVEQAAVIEIQTPMRARALVRDLDKAGVDLIKVGLQERSYNGEPLNMMSEEVLCAIVDEAHQQELRVVVHAATRASYDLALACGVDILGHGCLDPIDDATIEKIVQKDILVMPTLFVFESPLWGPAHLERLDEPETQRTLTPEIIAHLRQYAAEDKTSYEVLPPYLQTGISREDARKGYETLLESTRRMHAAGVKLGLGTDAPVCFNWHGSPVQELKRLEDVGLTPLQALSVATRGGAQILNLQDAIGTLAVGYRADLIAVAGKPDIDLDDVSHVEWSMIDGVMQNLDGPTLGEQVAGFSRLAWAWL
ncbi:MAG: hypothetical protein A2289_16420 [Deltaproteobacteria bacterium RIFOXYA12_FULL_58_15]|nr:MAG: hypothetical protein A2289_16420 [Deltaproteobacteria bacterium RIFOXYA12_FULL_58_15]